ncbi:hypothetical protein X560_1632 [Listeria fleischmannii 1991]|nr:Crp/Fnr family transcriptional regulator [Listeria fleischmannii]KMT59304.1 hypothetical protein X560_1632 [Listeria fleischmannii 1991]
MKILFNADEFVNGIKKELPNAIEKIKVQPGTILSFEEIDSCYIISSGVIGGFIRNPMESKSEQVYSFFSKGDVVGFGQIFDNFKGMIFEAITEVDVYAIKKLELEFWLSFPENTPFIYYIMKRFGTHYYLKSLLSLRTKSNVLPQSIYNLCFLLETNINELDFVKFPKEFTQSRLMEYSTLSQGGFYKHLDILYKAEILSRDSSGITVNMKKMRDSYPNMHFHK